MLVEIMNVNHRYGMKDGKRWDLTSVHVKTDKNDVVEVKVWKELPQLKAGMMASIVFEGKYSYKTKQFFGVVTDFKV
jgi:hypothetical protein